MLERFLRIAPIMGSVHHATQSQSLCPKNKETNHHFCLHLWAVYINHLHFQRSTKQHQQNQLVGIFRRSFLFVSTPFYLWHGPILQENALIVSEPVLLLCWCHSFSCTGPPPPPKTPKSMNPSAALKKTYHAYAELFPLLIHVFTSYMGCGSHKLIIGANHHRKTCKAVGIKSRQDP